jgi:DNA-binding transcriptional LysR family regulator
LALAGHGVVIGPSFALGADVAEGRLVPLLTEWRRRELPIHALYPHRLLLSAKIRTFVDLLAERLGGDRDCDQGQHESDTSAPSIKA